MGNQVTVPITTRKSANEVFYGGGPAAWADLDLSAVVGKRKALVFLRVLITGGNPATNFKFKMKEDAYYPEEIVYGCGDLKLPSAASGGARQGYVTVITDDQGIIDWITIPGNSTVQIIIKGFVVLL